MGLVDFAQRNLRQLASGGWVRGTSRLAFIHVPKCGGTSMEIALKTALGPGAQLTGITSFSHDPVAALRASEVLSANYREYSEDLLPYYLAKKRAKYVCGHWALRDGVYEAFQDQWDFVLLLRDPVKRFISNYFFNRYKAEDHFRIHTGLSDFLGTERAENYGRAFLRYLAPDSYSFGDTVPSELVEAAASRLARYRIVGVLENLDGMAADFERIYGAKLIVPHVNRNPVPSGDRKVSSSEMARIEEICAPDIAIYNRAAEMCGQRPGPKE